MSCHVYNVMYVFVCLSLSVFVCLSVCMRAWYVCMSECMNVCVYIHIYIYVAHNIYILRFFQLAA